MSREYEEMQVEKWVNLEDVAEHLSISQDTVRTWKENSRFTGLANDINSKSLKLMNGCAKEKFRTEHQNER